MLRLMSLILDLSLGVAGYTGITHLLVEIARHSPHWTQLIFARLCRLVAAHPLALPALRTPGAIPNYLIIPIAFTANNDSGARCTSAVLISLPHDKNDTLVDVGTRFDSTVVP
jgi:hypothetical protein